MLLLIRRKHRALKSARNQAMMKAFDHGTPVAALMEEYGLGEKRVRAILADERNRRLNSPEPFYRTMRNASETS